MRDGLSMSIGLGRVGNDTKMTCDFFQTFNMQRTLAVIHPPNFQVLFWVRFFSVFFMYSISSNEIAGTNTHDRIALDKHLMFDKKKDAILLIQNVFSTLLEGITLVHIDAQYITSIKHTCTEP